MGRLPGGKYLVYCKYCGKQKLVHPCVFIKKEKKDEFYCSVSHQVLWRNKFNNPAKNEETKKKIGKSSRERRAIEIARNSENYINRIFKRGKDHPFWKEEVTYKSLHGWLNKTFGKAIKCEKCGKTKSGKSKTFGWALLKGRKYEKKRENFWMLCRSCHNTYDGTIRNIKKMRKYYENNN